MRLISCMSRYGFQQRDGHIYINEKNAETYFIPGENWKETRKVVKD